MIDKATNEMEMVMVQDTTDEREKEYLFQFFTYVHLPEQLQIISKEFHKIASFIIDKLPSNPERTVALRKLLEAKDCAVRSRLSI